MMHRAYVALGCNLGNRERNLRDALAAIDLLPATRVTVESSIYVTAPVGVSAEQPDYFNAVIGIDTRLSARGLLEALQQIELAAGRVREPGTRNAARSLDLDVLLYDEQIIAEPGLLVPHPRMRERAFVLLPLVEIAPDIVIRGVGPARSLLSGVAAQRISRLDTVRDPDHTIRDPERAH